MVIMAALAVAQSAPLNNFLKPSSFQTWNIQSSGNEHKFLKD